MSGHAWYACYGSNLSWPRFRCYLEGGSPPGSARVQPGCRDRSHPSGDRPVELPGRVHFARHSVGWGGAVAFLDVEARGTATGRAYRLSADQFADVVAQENASAPGAVSLDVGAVVAAHRADVCTGWYGTVVHVGDVDGEPLLTITGDPPDPPRPPSAAYLTTIATGLAESHRWTPAQVATYLLACPGVSAAWSITQVEELATASGGSSSYSTPSR